MCTILPADDARWGVDLDTMPIPDSNHHNPSPDMYERATAAIEATLSVRPRWGITPAHRVTAAGLLAAFWTCAESLAITRDDLRAHLDLPSACLSLAIVQHARARYREEIDRAALLVTDQG